MHIKILALALIAFAAPACAEMTGSLSLGFDYSTGKYGDTTSTDILYVPVTGKLQLDYLYLKLTVPYVSITGTGDVILGMGKLGRRTTSTTTSKTTTQSGLGDIIASAGYMVYESDVATIDLVGNVKFGTGDASKNLGTGENDYSIQFDGYYTTADYNTLFATAGYRLVGAPAGTTVYDIAYGTLGFSLSIGESSSTGLMLDAAEASSDLSPGTSEISAFVSTKFSQDITIQARLMKGLSDSSPDSAGGITISRIF